MNPNVLPTVIATLIATVIATLTALFVNRRRIKENLDSRLETILKIAVEYPYLEHLPFTSQWQKRKKTDERYQRYDLYCNLIFNYLESLSDYLDYDAQKIEKEINIRDWLRLHKECWKNPSTPHENRDSYPAQFVTLVNNYLD